MATSRRKEDNVRRLQLIMNGMPAQDDTSQVASLQSMLNPQKGQSQSISYTAEPSPSQYIMPLALADLDPSKDLKSKSEAALLEQIAATRAQPTDINLAPLADFANFLSTSGRKVTAPKPSNTVDDKQGKLLAIQEMLMKDQDAERDSRVKLAGALANIQGSRMSVSASDRPPSGFGVDDRFVRRQVTALNKQIGPDKIAKAHTNLKKVYGLIDGFDPTNEASIPGVGAFGMGKLEAINPFDKDRAKAQQNRAAILNALVEARNALFGTALSAHELQSALEREGMNIWASPTVLRSFLKSEADKLKLKVETDLAGYDPEVREAYYKNPGAVRPEAFDVSTWGKAAPPPVAPPAAAPGIAAQVAPKQLSTEQKREVEALKRVDPAAGAELEALYLK